MPLPFNPRKEVFVERDIHYMRGCPHRSEPLAVLRGAYLQGWVSGDFTQARNELQKALTQPAELTFDPRCYQTMIDWVEHRITTGEANEQLRVLAERALTLPGDKRVIAAEMTASRVLVLAHGGEEEAAREIIEHFYELGGREKGADTVLYIAQAFVWYICGGDALTAERFLAQGNDKMVGIQIDPPCYKEVPAVFLAVIRAELGDFMDARLALVAAGLTLGNVDPFWDEHSAEQGRALAEALRWHHLMLPPGMER